MKRIFFISLATAIITQAIIYLGNRVYRAGFDYGFDAGKKWFANKLLKEVYGNMHQNEYRFITTNYFDKVTK